MATDENRLFVAIGMLQSEVENLREDFHALQATSTEEHRKVHDIVVATSEAMRNLARDVAEMKPLTDDYRERRAEKRGEDRYKRWLYGIAAGSGGFIVFILGKIWDVVAARPHP